MVFIFLGCFLNALLLLLLLLAAIVTTEWVCFHIFGFVSPLHFNCLELDDTNTKQAWHPGEAFTKRRFLYIYRFSLVSVMGWQTIRRARLTKNASNGIFNV